MSKSTTRDRTAARRIVAEQKAREKRRAVTLWTSVAVVVVLVIAGMIGWGVLAGQDRDTAGKLTVPPSAVDEGTAFAVGTGPVKIDIYEDFLCPNCAQFESSAEATLQQLISSGKATVQYHPIAILDRLSNGTQYSTRAVGAAAAAAESGQFTEFHRVLYQNQPAENTPGLTDAQLIDLGKSVGLTDAKFADAITDRTYWAWATRVTEQAGARNVTGTPTIRVAGKDLTDRSPAALEQAVAQAAG